MADAIHKVPPNDPEAEAAVLGSIIIDNNEYINVCNTISLSDFYKSTNQAIFAAIEKLITAKQVADNLTLSSALRSAGKLDKCGGASYIASLADNVSSSSMARHYAEIVKENSLRRQVIRAGTDLLTSAYDRGTDLAVFLPEIQQSLVNIVTKKAPKIAKKTVLQEVEEWVHSKRSNEPIYSSLLVSLLSCYYDLNYQSKEDKSSCRMAFKRLCEKGTLEPQGGRSGMYKLLNGLAAEIDYISAEDEPWGWKCPLKSHELVNIYPGSVILIAGEGNSGKTAYCLNVSKTYGIIQNDPVNYFSSEMEDIELRARLQRFELPLDAWKKNVRFIQRSSNFAEVVKADQLNIIDYLEVYKDFYEVAGLIRGIKDKIGKGIAIIAIQKPPGRDEGVGGQSTKNLSRLYIAMSPGKAKIVKGKMWASIVNPDGMAVEFKLVGGAKFQVKDAWVKETKVPF